MINILCLGDVVADEGVRYLEDSGRLRKLRDRCRAELVIVNGENSAEGNGITPDSADRLIAAGADIITGGNHTWQRREVYAHLDECPYMLRPLNYPAEAAGVGYTITKTGGRRVLVMNVAGTVFLEPVTPPAEAAERVLERERGNYDIAVCDIHAEATSEKLFFARYFDGRFSAVFGTHTHVATADIQVLPGGTGYITDLGMCGSTNGILGVKTECVIRKFTVRTPVRFESAKGNPQLCGALFSIDEASGKCTHAERICE